MIELRVKSITLEDYKMEKYIYNEQNGLWYQQELTDRIYRGKYTPSPVRRVEIPKPDSKDEKMKYVRLHLGEHMPLGQIEREYGIGNALVEAWVKKYLKEGEDALEPHNGNPYAALHRSKSLTEVERLRLMVAKQEVKIARLKKGTGWKELVQTGNTLLAAERLRSSRRTQSKISSRFSMQSHGDQPFRPLQMEGASRPA